MAKTVLCLTSEYIEIDYLKSVFTCRPLLKSYLQNICDASLNCQNVPSEQYLGYKIPLRRIESALLDNETDIVVVSKYYYDLQFLRLEEALMHVCPNLSFLLRNSFIEKQATDQLVQCTSGTANLLFVALYNNSRDVVTIPIK
tara:strand:- start:2283 stop:2711 length:429 start_codon:yes stop_codon:yes gene_type:complete